MKAKQSKLQLKKQKFIFTSGILIAVVIAAVAFATVIAYMIPWRYDMTGQRIFELSEETIEVVENIKGNVKIGAVYATGNEDAMVSALLKEYEKLSPDIEVEFLDAEKNPSVLAGYELGDVKAVANGTIIVNGNGRHKLIASSDIFYSGDSGNIFYGESEITGALRYVSADTLPKIYFTQGHGEIKTGSDMTEAVSMLERNAYEVEGISLLETGEIPDDASEVVIASPTEDISEEEAEILFDYIEKGGRIMLLIDPTLSVSDDNLKNLSAVAEKFGIDIENNFVFEEDSSYYLTLSNMYLIPRYGIHEITSQMIEEEKLPVLPLVRGLKETEHDESVTLKAIMQSSDSSWMRTDLSIAGESMTDEDIQGPITLGYASERSGGAKMVAIGDANFACDGNLTMQGNGDLWINSVNWLSGGREAEIIAGKVINSNNMIVRGNDFIKLTVICCIVMPALMFAGAVLVWRSRKNK